MIPWDDITTWGGRLAVITGLATPIYGGMVYYRLTPVTEAYVTAQLGTVKQDIAAGRVDTLDTKRVVLGLARDRLMAEKQNLEAALKSEKNENTRQLWIARIQTIEREVVNLDHKAEKIEERLWKMEKNE